MAKKPTEAQIKQFSILLKQAHEGSLPWMDRLVTGAGYLKPASTTATAVSLLFGVTKQAVGLWSKKMECPRNADGTYNLREVIKWKMTPDEDEELKSALAADPDNADAKLMLREKARMAQIKRQDMERYLLPRDMLHAALGRMAGILRRMGEALQSTYGAQAQEPVDDALAEFEREIEGLGAEG